MTIAIPTPTSIFQECPFCKGTGVLKSVESMVLDVIRLLQMACQRADITSVEVNVHPEVADVLLNEKQAKLQELEDTGMKLAGEYLHQCADIRRSGSAALDLAYLACGRHDIFFELRLKPWDYAAGSLIVQEAGGLVQMPLAGEEMDYNLSTAVLSANPQCMPMALEVFRETVLPDLGKE